MFILIFLDKNEQSLYCFSQWDNVLQVDQNSVKSTEIETRWRLIITGWIIYSAFLLSIGQTKDYFFLLFLFLSLRSLSRSLPLCQDALGFCSFSGTNACGFYLLLKARRGCTYLGCASAYHPFCYCLSTGRSNNGRNFLKFFRVTSLHRAGSIQTATIDEILALY